MFEICDVEAVAAANMEVYWRNDDFMDLKGPVATFGSHSFEFHLIYKVDRAGAVTQSTDIGFYVWRSDASEDVVVAGCRVHVQNAVGPGLESVLPYRRFWANSQHTFPSVYSEPDRARETGGYRDVLLRFGDILDRRNNWLHQHDALRVVCEISIARGLERVESVDDGSLTQSVGQSLKAVLESGDFADLTLKVEGEEIRVHSQIVAARSPVFHAMLSAHMREAEEKEVTIEDLGVKAMRGLVSFLYTGECVSEDLQQDLQQDDDTLALLQAAHRFQAAPLVATCVAALSARLDVETVSERLQLADLIDCGIFREACVEYMCQRMPDVKKTQSYARMLESRPLLLSLLVDATWGTQLARSDGEASAHDAAPDRATVPHNPAAY